MSNSDNKQNYLFLNPNRWLIFKPKQWDDWFKEGLEDFFYSSLGNLLPIWGMVIANFLDKDSSFSLYESIHQPFTYVILSGTYLTSTFYLQSKPKMGNKLFKFFYAPFLFIIGLLVAKKPILEDLSASYYVELFVVIVFLICFLSYIFILFQSHYKRLNLNLKDKVKEEREELETEFDKLK
ncbi:cell division protein FtsL [Aequorivita sinensis]|uniref:cell division protein FtsL n=1 Tax=Aequorivita sinensis TaxID=1382458 RepID=UPI00230178B8|nr:cell division protein FtsL [Aequorivita sinensis]